ncbi:polyprenyl synthetase family protein [soil metagenome]
MPARSDDCSALEILERDSRLVDAYLRSAISARRDSGSPARLFDAIEYSLFAGGKRLRPALVIECFRACGALPAGGDVAPCLAAAGAIELIHTFSLVHDDLPAMDDDELRRGKPTSHKVFGEAMAILAGDAMMTLAFELLADDAPTDLVAPLSLELARAAGTHGMIGGQVLDMEGENKSLDLTSLESLHAMKTGALLRCAARMGAICARTDSTTLARVSSFAEHLGVAFQIIDDLLDVTSTPKQLGKQNRKDASRGKNTYPALLGLDGAKAEADRQLRLALAAIESIGETTHDLRTLAEFTITRNR